MSLLKQRDDRLRHDEAGGAGSSTLIRICPRCPTDDRPRRTVQAQFGSEGTKNAPRALLVAKCTKHFEALLGGGAAFVEPAALACENFGIDIVVAHEQCRFGENLLTLDSTTGGGFVCHASAFPGSVQA